MNFIKKCEGFLIFKGYHGEYRVVPPGLKNKPQEHRLFDSLNQSIKYCKRDNGHLDFSKQFKFNEEEYCMYLENNKDNGNTLPDPDPRDYWE